MKSLLIPAIAALASLATAQTLTIQDALQTASTNRPAIESARLEVENARLFADALAAYPALKLGVGQSTRDIGATDDDLYISQPIDVFGRTSARSRLGSSQVKVAEAGLRETLLTVQTSVLKHYFAAAATVRISEVSNELVNLAQSLKDASLRRFEEGRIPEVQVTRANLELERAKQTAALRRSQSQAALKRLAASMGLEQVDFVINQSESLTPLAEITLADRPDLLRLEALTDVAQAETLVAKRSNLPELELIGLRSPWRDQPTEFGARLQLTWSLLDYGKSRNEAKAAQRQAEASRKAYQDAHQKAQAELEAIGIELQAATDQVASYETLRESARDLVEKSQRGYSEGVGTLIDVLEATRALREIEEELAEAQLSLHLAEVARYEAAGFLMEAIR